MNVRYQGWKVASSGFTPDYDAFCVSTNGFQCPGPEIVTTFPPFDDAAERKRRNLRDRRDLLDLLALLQESIGYG